MFNSGTIVPFFRTAIKYFLNEATSIKLSMQDFFSLQINQYLQKIDSEVLNRNLQKSMTGSTIIKKSDMFGLEENISYREQLRKAQNSNSVTLHEFLMKTEENPVIEDAIAINQTSEQINIQTDKMRVRYAVYFVTSILKLRHKYDFCFPHNSFLMSDFKLSDQGVLFDVEDIIKILEQHPLKIYETIQKNFSKVFGMIKTIPFLSFSNTIVESIFNEFLVKTERNRNVEIQYQSWKYPLLPRGRKEDKDIFDYVTKIPVDDPFPLLGYSKNDETVYNFEKSKRFFGLVVQIEEKLEKSSNLEREIDLLDEAEEVRDEEGLSESVSSLVQFLADRGTVSRSLEKRYNLINFRKNKNIFKFRNHKIIRLGEKQKISIFVSALRKKQFIFLTYDYS